DDVRWPRYSSGPMPPAAIRSLLRATGADGVAESPALLVFGARFVDPATGAGVPEVRIPADVGRPLRIEVEGYGTEPDPIARLVRVGLRGDQSGGIGDPVVAAESALVPAAALDPRSYLSAPRPVVALDWVAADVPGAVGLYIDVDERRLSPVRDE